MPAAEAEEADFVFGEYLEFHFTSQKCCRFQQDSEALTKYIQTKNPVSSADF